MAEHLEIDVYLEEAFELHEEGKGYADIRKHFSDLGLAEEKIGYIIRLLDEFVVEEEKIAARVKSATNRVMYGVLVLLVGFVVVYLFWSNDSLEGLYIALGLTPVVAGLAAIWTGYRSRHYWKNRQPEIDDAKLKLRRKFG